MMALFARVKIKEGHVERFLKYLEVDFHGSLAEPGCVRFDVLRDEADPVVFYLYEVYVDADAYERHKQAPYLQALFAEAGDTFAGPPEGYRAVPLWPREPTYWSKDARSR
jgi:(4S)-4-hydroxy-5-phosphonooxypentane-2,3-dione isomerase